MALEIPTHNYRPGDRLRVLTNRPDDARLAAGDEVTFSHQAETRGVGGLPDLVVRDGAGTHWMVNQTHLAWLPLDSGTTTFVTKDSGLREEFDTGSRRDSREGKGRYDLLPPEAVRRLAQLYERGAAKYGDRNWEKGQPVSRYLDSLLRHVFAYLEGERTEDHLAAAAWNAFSAITTEERAATGALPAELSDLRPVA